MLTPRLQKVIAGFVALGGGALIVIGALMWTRTAGLESRGVVTQATLTSVRRRGDSETGIVATYVFEVSGKRFHRTGLFGEVSADITAAQAADPSRSIEVRYLPDDPWINEPVSGVTPTATRQIIAVVIGVLMLLAAAVRWMSASRSGPGRRPAPR